MVGKSKERKSVRHEEKNGKDRHSSSHHSSKGDMLSPLLELVKEGNVQELRQTLGIQNSDTANGKPLKFDNQKESISSFLSLKSTEGNSAIHIAAVSAYLQAIHSYNVDPWKVGYFIVDI